MTRKIALSTKLVPLGCLALIIGLASCASSRPMLMFQDNGRETLKPLASGASLLEGQIKVNRVQRWSNLFTLRLENATDDRIVIQYRAIFLHESGASIQSSTPRWKGLILPPHEMAEADVVVPDVLKKRVDGITVQVREVRR